MRVIDCRLLALSTALFASWPSAFCQGTAGQDQTTRRGYVASAALPPDESQSADTYPHITTLEKAILGQAYVGQALKDRLARMESKAFGKPSTSNDLSDRTDALEDYSQKTLHQKPFGAGSAADVEQYESTADSPPPGYASAPGSAQAMAPDGGEAPSPQPEYPHITNLEKEILSQTFPGQPLPDRLARLETKAFGKPSTIADYSERTDALEAYAQKKLHNKPFVQEQKQEAEAAGGGSPSGQSSGGSKLLSIVGNSLLSMAGVGRMGMGGLGMGGMGGNPVFGNGMGGGIVPGFGGVRARPRQASDQPQPAAPVDNHPEDSSVHESMPPAVGAKLLTKVGWCEVQMFGHTFPNLHLQPRLQQLSHELNYAPGKSALELMDDADGMVKAVQARKQGTRAAAGASPTVKPPGR